MKTLNNNQILYIKNDLKSRKISSGYKPELLDHVCCMVEGYLNEDLVFAEAYAKALVDFSDQGFIELKPQSPVVRKKRKFIASQLAGATIAASILMMFFGVGAQDRPEINPLSDDAVVSSAFGLRMDPRSNKKQYHLGIDFRCDLGTPIKATASGKVIEVEDSEKGYGKRIIIQHDEHFQTKFAHLSEIKVKQGQRIELGEIIGLTGNSGFSTGPHLHYEVLKDGKRVDPAIYLAKQE